MKYICYQCMEDTNWLFGDSRCRKCTREDFDEEDSESILHLDNFNNDENLKKLGEIFSTMGSANVIERLVSSDNQK